MGGMVLKWGSWYPLWTMFNGTEHLSNDHKGSLNQHENSHKLCNEMEHLA